MSCYLSRKSDLNSAMHMLVLCSKNKSNLAQENFCRIKENWKTVVRKSQRVIKLQNEGSGNEDFDTHTNTAPGQHEHSSDYWKYIV